MTINDCRPEVQTFAVAMERKLRANDHKGGWKNCEGGWLLKRLFEEAEELRDAWLVHVGECARGTRWVEADAFHGFPDTSSVVLNEAADVANFAMMLADVNGCLDVKREG